MALPLITKIKGYPFEVIIAGDPPSVAFADKLESLDWTVRKARFKSGAPR